MNLLTPHTIAIACLAILPMAIYLSMMLVLKFVNFTEGRHKRRRGHAHNH